MRFQRDERVERRRARRRQVRRRRVAALLVVAGVVTLVAVSTTSLVGPSEDKSTAGAAAARPPELPGGGTEILPKYRVVAFYGYPRGGERLGVLGAGSPSAVAERLKDQALDYDSLQRRVLPAFELIATIAHDFPTGDGRYRSRLSDAVIEDYLHAARQVGAILILDIQPGRAEFIDEVRSFERWLKEPDVSLALDPEWSARAGQIPGKGVIGSTDATVVNEVSAYLDRIAHENHLPQKLLLVHQFTENMVRNKSAIVERPGLAIVMNIDGFGTPEEKTGRYTDLTSDPDHPRFAFNGFKLFYEEDTRKGSLLMGPFDVLDLEPQPDVIVYE